METVTCLHQVHLLPLICHVDDKHLAPWCCVFLQPPDVGGKRTASMPPQLRADATACESPICRGN